MRLNGIIVLFILVALTCQAQDTDSLDRSDVVFRNTLYTSQFGKAQVGGYAQIDYNQPFGNDVSENGTMDIHRLVVFLGHRFNDRLNFFTEIELEHVEEVSVEQAFLEYKLTNWLNFRGGLILIPMGIVNEYHEPPTFNGVERPNLDKYIIPSTWREIGIGFAGNLPSSSISYQAYLVNGPLSYDGGALFRGVDGIRKGRQKGIESTFSGSPNVAMKVRYYGIAGLNLGASGYFGQSQTTLNDGLDKSNALLSARADSSKVGIQMVEVDARYRKRAFQARAQWVYTHLSNTNEYNAFTGTDLGSRMTGYFVEAGYDLLGMNKQVPEQLILFGRYEKYNTHSKVYEGLQVNAQYDRTDLTFGLTFKPSENTAFKADYQHFSNALPESGKNQLNLGVGVWF